MRWDLRGIQGLGVAVWVLVLVLLYLAFALRGSASESEAVHVRRQEELYVLAQRLEETMGSVIALVEESTNLTVAATEQLKSTSALRRQQRNQQQVIVVGETAENNRPQSQKGLTTSEVSKKAPLVPGTFVQSGNSEYFRYLRTSGNCSVTDVSLKYDEHCIKDLAPRYIRQVLVVAVQRSGTHFIWEMLNRLQCDVHHEGVGPDGSVSWLYAYRARRYTINNPEPLTRHRFRYVFHQVRHPLRVISTLMALQRDWNRFWEWTFSVEKSVHRGLTPLKRAMQLWVAWNKHIEKYADLRFRSEDTSPRDVCRWAGFPESKCSSSDPNKPIVDPTVPSGSSGGKSNSGESNHSAPRLEVSWAELDAEDSALSRTIKEMCLEYGYELDPSVLPQLASTKEFKA